MENNNKYFTPYIVNPLTEDPAILLKISNEKRVFLIDCGLLENLKNKDVQRITHIFISHTHIDHFIGFDKVIRFNTGFSKTINVFGPKGIIDQVHYKILSYTWNLITKDNLRLKIFEIDSKLNKIYIVNLYPEDKYKTKYFENEIFLKNNIIYDEEKFFVKYMPLNHKIECLAYSFIEKDKWKVNKENLKKLNLPPGNWIKVLKNEVSKGNLENFVEIKEKKYKIKELKEKLLINEKGIKISYVTDTIYDEEVEKKIVKLAKNSDILFCEAHFLHKDLEKAKISYHLTALQTGIIAKKSNVKKVIGFHFSPRYCYKEQKEIIKEIEKGFLL